MLRYVGRGWLVGVPARDLKDSEVRKYGGLNWLLSSGLYVEDAVEEPVIQPAKKRKTKEVKHDKHKVE